jgi:hypothetical protein
MPCSRRESEMPTDWMDKLEAKAEDNDRLRARVAELEAALREIIDSGALENWQYIQTRARAALKEGEGE